MDQDIPITQLPKYQYFTAGVLSRGWMATLGGLSLRGFEHWIHPFLPGESAILIPLGHVSGDLPLSSMTDV